MNNKAKNLLERMNCLHRKISEVECISNFDEAYYIVSRCGGFNYEMEISSELIKPVIKARKMELLNDWDELRTELKEGLDD